MEIMELEITVTKIKISLERLNNSRHGQEKERVTMRQIHKDYTGQGTGRERNVESEESFKEMWDY